MGGIRVGTSGWSYDHWDGAFYPERTPHGKRLAYYATRFPTVEINATYYRLPSEKAVRTWSETARSATRVAVSESAVGPDESTRDNAFLFAVKGSRLVTHYHRLRDVDDAVTAFAERVGQLDETLGVVLWQLPASMQRDTETLDAFLTLLDSLAPASPGRRFRHAVEFRHSSWLAEDTFSVLRAHDAAHVHVSSSVMPEDFTTTTDFVYVRFHGLTDYAHDYSRRQLEPWAEFLRAQHEAGRDGYVYFNNDARARAPANASVLVELLGDAAYALDSRPSDAAQQR